MFSKDIVVIDGARTPFGEFTQSYKDLTATDLGVLASKEAMKRSGVDPSKIGHVVFGNAEQTQKDAIYLARHIGLRSGVPTEVPALIVGRICGSGLQAMVTGANYLMLGEAEYVLAGGTENMSQAPYVLWGARNGWGLGTGKMEDYLWEAFTDTLVDTPMAVTAENLAEKYNLTREEVDEFAVRSQQLAIKGWDEGRLGEECFPVEVKGRKGPVLVERDEHLRPVTMEQLAKLPARFKKGGVVTAGNASGINDGAAAVVMTTMETAQREGIKPLARLVSYATVGVPPEIMGIGPAYAIPAALKKAGMTLDQMDLIEINEAFGPQYLACEKHLELDRDKCNVNGGAIAIGHPLGASGVRVSLTLMYELRRRGKKYGVSSLCIGGGQGIAAVWENLQA